jgi:hypothetical protein
MESLVRIGRHRSLKANVWKQPESTRRVWAASRGEVLKSLVGPFAGHPGCFSRHLKGCGIIIGQPLGKDFEYAVPERQLTTVVEVV